MTDPTGSIMLGLAEPDAIAGLLLVLGLLMALSLVFASAFRRFGVPIMLGFMLLGMIGGSEGPGGIEFDNHMFALRAGMVALILILFDGGMNSSIGAIRKGIAPASVPATVGVVGTAGIMTLVGRVLGLSWAQAMLVGAIVSSTDAAAVILIVRGEHLVPARGGTRIDAGDFVYVFCKEHDEPVIGLMLGAPLGQA